MSRIRNPALLAATLFVAAGYAQTYTTFTTLYTFTGAADGAGPQGPLIQPPDGNFYGTTAANYDPQTGALTGSGTFFKIAAAGSLTTLYSFSGTEASSPTGRLTLGTDGNFYGTTNDCCNSAIAPTVFRITPAGALTTLYTFGPEDGSFPNGLILGADGNFYGTTAQGGGLGGGTVFRITPTGTFTKLHDFTNGHDGSSPMSALTQGPDGSFYGTTFNGGANWGTVFKITPGGTLTTLHTFDQLDGQNPQGALVLGNDGNFYGTTSSSTIPGGPDSNGPSTSGIVFRISPSGTFTTLSYLGVAIWKLTAGLALGKDGNFYGVSPTGDLGTGTIFQITPAGVVTLLYEFSTSPFSFPDQSGGLTLGADGNFYGVTGGTGTPGNPGTWGTVYKLSVGSDPGYLAINLNGVVNAASYAVNVAPGSIVAVYGVFPIANPVSATSVPLPTEFSGVGLQFPWQAPLFYGSMVQINAQIPWETAQQIGSSPPLTVQAQLGQEYGAPQYVSLAPYAPGIFVVNAQTNQGAILDANYQLVGPTNPAAVGSYVQIFCTGLGPVTNQPATGAVALSDPLSMTIAPPTVTIGNMPAYVAFSGLAPGEVGLNQINVQVPAGAPSGPAVPLVISVEGAVSNTATIAIQ